MFRLSIFVIFCCAALGGLPCAADNRLEAGQYEADIPDPLEPLNRGIFWFNERVDLNLIEPLARGYDYIVPDLVQTGVNNFFNNAAHPSYIVSDLVQFKFGQAGTHALRFLINTTGGVLGLIDLADKAGMEMEVEDFGIALAYRQVPPGPYLVLPFIGPSNFRDSVGLVVDMFLNPLSWLGAIDGISWEESTNIDYGLSGLYALQTRTNLLEAVEAGRESSLDYYYFVQSTYYQYRSNLLWDNRAPGTSLGDDVVGAENDAELLDDDLMLLDDDWQFEEPLE